MKARDYKAAHFLWSVDDDGVATLTLNRPERKNPLTFESYAEMRDLFRDLIHADDCKAVIVTGAGGNFSSGGDVQCRRRPQDRGQRGQQGQQAPPSPSWLEFFVAWVLCGRRATAGRGARPRTIGLHLADVLPAHHAYRDLHRVDGGEFRAAGDR